MSVKGVSGLCRLTVNPLCYLLLATLLLILSCAKTEEREGKGITGAQEALKKGIYRIELSPEYPDRKSTIRADVKGVNPADVSYQWMVNGRDIEGATGKTFRYEDLRKGDEVQVRVLIKDKGEVVSEPLTILNILPRIQRATLQPENPRVGDRVSVNVSAFDEDEDPVRLSYKWFVNGEPLNERVDSIEIDGERIKKGDRLSVTIIPKDDEAQGQPVNIYTVVKNSPPKALPDLKANFEGFTYTARVIANDPDGDHLTYTLKKAPEGMMIDPENGLITWKLKPEDEGEHEVTVSVDDGSGGEALINYKIRIDIKKVEKK